MERKPRYKHLRCVFVGPAGLGDTHHSCRHPDRGRYRSLCLRSSFELAVVCQSWRSPAFPFRRFDFLEMLPGNPFTKRATPVYCEYSRTPRSVLLSLSLSLVQAARRWGVSFVGVDRWSAGLRDGQRQCANGRFFRNRNPGP